MEKIILNSLLKNTKNNNLWFNVLSAFKEKNNDYIIEYKIVYNIGNGNRFTIDNFTYKSHLNDFAKREKVFLERLIEIRKHKPRNKTIISETIIV